MSRTRLTRLRASTGGIGALERPQKPRSADAVAELARDPYRRGGGGLHPCVVGARQGRGGDQGAADVAALVADRGGDRGDIGLALPVVDRVAEAADFGKLLEQLLDGA